MTKEIANDTSPLEGHANFVHLRTRSAYSLLDGMLHPPEIVRWAASQQMPAIGLADARNLFGVVEFALAANKAGVQPLIAAAVTIAAETSTPIDDRSKTILLIAQNATGYANLNRIVTKLYMPIDGSDAKDYQQMNLSFAELAEHNEGLILLTGGLGAPLGDMVLSGQHESAELWLDHAKEVFGNRLFLEVQRHGLEGEGTAHETLIAMADKRQIPLVATNDCRFPRRDQQRYHDALRAVGRGEKVNQSEARLCLNDSYYFRDVLEMENLFADLPDALENTLHVARMCQFTLEDQSQKPKMPRITLPDNLDENDYLWEKTRKGLEYRLKIKGLDAQSEHATVYSVSYTHLTLPTIYSV